MGLSAQAQTPTPAVGRIVIQTRQVVAIGKVTASFPDPSREIGVALNCASGKAFVDSEVSDNNLTPEQIKKWVKDNLVITPQSITFDGSEIGCNANSSWVKGASLNKVFNLMGEKRRASIFSFGLGSEDAVEGEKPLKSIRFCSPADERGCAAIVIEDGLMSVTEDDGEYFPVGDVLAISQGGKVQPIFFDGASTPAGFEPEIKYALWYRTDGSQSWAVLTIDPVAKSVVWSTTTSNPK